MDMKLYFRRQIAQGVEVCLVATAVAGEEIRLACAWMNRVAHPDRELNSRLIKVLIPEDHARRINNTGGF